MAPHPPPQASTALSSIINSWHENDFETNVTNPLLEVMIRFTILFCLAFRINKSYSNYFISCMQMIKDLLQCHLSTIEVNPNVFFTQSLWTKLQFLRISFQQLYYIPYLSGSYYNTCLKMYQILPTKQPDQYITFKCHLQ